MNPNRLLPLHRGQLGEHIGIYTDNADYPSTSLAQNVHVATIHHSPALADYLVRAANSHPELIATLRKLETALIMHAGEFEDKLLEIVQEALDKHS